MEAAAKIEDVGNKIIHIQNCEAILDSDVATLYGDGTKEIN
jgi:hypothetical protein